MQIFFWLSRFPVLLDLLACCFCSTVPYKDLTLDGIKRQRVTGDLCLCDTCNTTEAAYTEGNFDNVAYGRPVSVSSVLDTDSAPCHLTNGLLESCFRSDIINAGVHWAEIDLGYVITFKTMTVTGIDLETTYPRGRLIGLKFFGDGLEIMRFVSNIEEWEQLPPGPVMVLYFLPTSARYIRIEKPYDWYHLVYDRVYNPLELCNVAIWVCISGYYYNRDTENCVPCDVSCPHICDNYRGCELVKFDVAVKKTATMMDGGSGDPEKMVDGVVVKNETKHCVFLQRQGQVVWFLVTFGVTFMVYSAELQPDLASCDASEIIGYQVVVGDEPNIARGKLCGKYVGALENCLYPLETACVTPLAGSHLYVIRHDSLTFCELRAYGHRYHKYSLNGECKEGRTYSGCDVDCCVCDGNKCKLKVGEKCSKNDDCAGDAVCDFNVCKMPAGKSCQGKGDCVMGALCVEKDGKVTCSCAEGITTFNKGACEPVQGLFGGSCDGGCKSKSQCSKDSGVCQCLNGYTLNIPTLTCARGLDAECSSTDPCISGLICDRETSKCLIPFGKSCRDEGENDCMTGSICDVDKVCRVDLNENCDGWKVDDCKTGTICDMSKQCSIKAGDPCMENDAKNSCVAGATCKENKCVCNPDISTQDGPLCAPNAGQVGGLCQSGTTCLVAKAECVEGMCTCTASAYPDRAFNCTFRRKLSKGDDDDDDDDDSVVQVLLYLYVVTAVVVVFGGVSYFAKKKYDKKERQGKETGSVNMTQVRTEKSQGENQNGNCENSQSEGTSLAQKGELANQVGELTNQGGQPSSQAGELTNEGGEHTSQAGELTNQGEEPTCQVGEVAA